MKPISANLFYHAADHMRQSWHVVVPNDTLLEDCFKPGLFVNGATLLKPMALIDIVTQDGLLDVQVRVVRIVDGMVIVRPRMIYEDTERRKEIIAAAAAVAEGDQESINNEPAPKGYKVGFIPSKGYYVQLKENGKKLIEGVASRPEALAYAKKHDEVANAVSPVGIKKVA